MGDVLIICVALFIQGYKHVVRRTNTVLLDDRILALAIYNKIFLSLSYNTGTRGPGMSNQMSVTRIVQLTTIRYCLTKICVTLCTVLLGKLTGSQPVKKFPEFVELEGSLLHLIFVVLSIMLYSSEISPTRCNNCVFILRNGFTLQVSGDNLTHHQVYICCIWPQVSRLT